MPTPGHGQGEGPVVSKLSRCDVADDNGRGRSEHASGVLPWGMLPAEGTAAGLSGFDYAEFFEEGTGLGVVTAEVAVEDGLVVGTALAQDFFAEGI